MKRLLVACALTLVAITANADAPAYSGVVMRGEVEYAFFRVDNEAGLMALFGPDPVEFCSGGPVEFDVLYWKDKDLQNGLRLNSLNYGEFVTSVWDFLVFDCEQFLTKQPLATGLSQLIWHDNDWFGRRYCDIKNNINAFGESAHGTLYTPSGEPKQFTWKRHGLYDCDTDTFPILFETIRLR